MILNMQKNHYFPVFVHVIIIMLYELCMGLCLIGISPIWCSVHPGFVGFASDINLGNFLVIILHIWFCSLLLLVIPLWVCYASCSCPRAPRYSVLFCFSFQFLFCVLRILLIHPLARRFFPQLCPVC